MHPLIRESGRWVKRARLRSLRRLSGDKIRYNTLLNQREIWHGRTVLQSTPREIQVGTNWTCNLKCFFCRREIGDKERLAALPSDKLEIPAAAMERLMMALPYAEIFTLTPLGEPLMYSGLGEFLDRYRRAGAKNLQLTTNGNVTTEKRARMLAESGVRRIYVSIDTAEPETYAQMRGGGSLDKATEGLALLNEWKARLHSDLPEIIIAATFLRRNIEHLPGLVRYAHANGIRKITVQLMDAEDDSIELETLGHHMPLTVRTLREAKRVADELGVELIVDLAMRNLLSAHSGEEGVSAFLAADRELDTRGKTLMDKCVYPWTFLVVDTDGDVRPCCWAGVSFGNLAEKPFDEVWNGAAVQRMRREFLNNRIPEYCRGKHCRVDL
jgi:MoaA/NifB/PqqE/SkfB family radical SAM enzyme